MKLLSPAESNPKFKKSMGRGFLMAGLSLRPSTQSGYNVCPWSTKGCEKACVLEHVGRANMPNVKDARDRKTIMLFEKRQVFLELLHKDLYALERKAKKENLIPLVRLNTASDLRWENIDPTIFTNHPDIQYYDYTKGAIRFNGPLPVNYQLTYSFNEESNHKEVLSLLLKGNNVAVVFDKKEIPTAWGIGGLTFPVSNGDTHDIRLKAIDGFGVIVGLYAKGGKAIVKEGLETGFIQLSINKSISTERLVA